MGTQTERGRADSDDVGAGREEGGGCREPEEAVRLRRRLLKLPGLPSKRRGKRSQLLRSKSQAANSPASSSSPSLSSASAALTPPANSMAIAAARCSFGCCFDCCCCCRCCFRASIVACICRSASAACSLAQSCTIFSCMESSRNSGTAFPGALSHVLVKCTAASSSSSSVSILAFGTAKPAERRRLPARSSEAGLAKPFFTSNPLTITPWLSLNLTANTPPLDALPPSM
mmetsp:Transcript_20739/g.42166  ORF Transcript_20739/g.42166 Transcript_20739/m.42166 type:complete len:230 (-) Transcript_20739:160-849(-)